MFKGRDYLNERSGESEGGKAKISFTISSKMVSQGTPEEGHEEKVE